MFRQLHRHRQEPWNFSKAGAETTDGCGSQGSGLSWSALSALSGTVPRVVPERVRTGSQRSLPPDPFRHGEYEVWQVGNSAVGSQFGTSGAAGVIAQRPLPPPGSLFSTVAALEPTHTTYRDAKYLVLNVHFLLAGVCTCIQVPTLYLLHTASSLPLPPCPGNKRKSGGPPSHLVAASAAISVGVVNCSVSVSVSLSVKSSQVKSGPRRFQQIVTPTRRQAGPRPLPLPY